MKPEIITIDHDEMTSPHAQEVEFALILNRMINMAKQDPTQLRFAVYEFARNKLENISWADEAERQRQLASLEIAIKGVEQFSQRVDQNLGLQGPAAALALGSSTPTGNQLAVIATNPGAHSEDEWKPLRSRVAGTKRARVIGPAISAAAGVLAVAALAAALYLPRALRHPESVAPTAIAAAPAIPKIAPAPPAVDFPLPTDYGIYALDDGKLTELDQLPIMVPDKRVAVSTPVSKQSQATLPNGHARFVAFRRDLAANAPDRIDVRIVAQVVRSLTFDARGKAIYSPVADEWSIRNTSFEFRVRPIAANPEMLLIQPEKPDFELPAGRYVLALKNQAFDFTIAGKATDPAQCLERTDAANGTFYSDCKSQ
jgi:hypothetical protein